MGAGGSVVAVVAALVGNLAIAVLKLLAGLFSGSAAMLAEAAHSFSDVGNQVLLLVGIRRAARPPSEKHPYGTAKAAYFWPFLVAILLFGVAGAYSLIEGVEKLLHPHEVGDVALALGVLAASFAIEAASLTVAARAAVKGARERGIGSVREFLAENRDASLLTVLVEDALALVGLPIAAVALLATKFTGNAAWDGAGSVVIGVLLMAFAVFLGAQTKSLLLGRGLSPRDLAKVTLAIARDPAVDGLVSVQSMYLGPDVVLLGAEVDLKDDLPGRDVEDALLRIETSLIAAVPALKFVYLEPRARPRESAVRPSVKPHAAHE